MTTAAPTTSHPSPPPPIGGDVLLATDGTALAASAARVAVAIARRHGRQLQAVHAVDTRGVPLPSPLGATIGLADELLGPGVHDAQRDEVRAAIAAALDAPVDWPVHVGIGAPAEVIARAASEAGAGLVVLGLRRHGALDRACQDETALLVMRRATWPVLGVVPSLGGPPRRVIAAVDFGRAGEAAARLAVALLAPGGALTLAHVPALAPPAGGVDDGEAYVHALGVRAALDRLRGELAAAAAADATIDTAVLDPMSLRPAGEQLLDLADRGGADLLALGSRRHGAFERWLLGSVATDVVRDGRVSVLVHP